MDSAVEDRALQSSLAAGIFRGQKGGAQGPTCLVHLSLPSSAAIERRKLRLRLSLSPPSLFFLVIMGFLFSLSVLLVLLASVAQCKFVGVATLLCDWPDSNGQGVDACQASPGITCPPTGGPCIAALAQLMTSPYETSVETAAVVLRPEGPNMPPYAQMAYTITFRLGSGNQTR